MMSFDDFLLLFNGTMVDFDNYFGDQCVDLVQFWSRAIGGPRFTGDAYQIFDEEENFYLPIKNSIDNYPSKGAIVVWSKDFNGTAGHVGICTGRADQNSFDAFEQNDPLGGNAHVKTYTYDYVLGWLQPPSPPVDTCPFDRDTNWNMNIQIFTALKAPLDSNNKEGSLQGALRAIADLQAIHGHPSEPTTPPTPPSAPGSPPVIDYKSYLVAIKGELNGKHHWYNELLPDPRLGKIAKTVAESGI